MVTKPQHLIADFFDNGASVVIVHDADGMEEPLQPFSAQLSIGITLESNMEKCVEVCQQLSRVVLIGAAVGVSGARFDKRVLKRIQLLRQRGFNGVIAVDEGIDCESGPLVLNTGANEIISGSAVFKSDNYGQAIGQLG